MLAHVTNYMLHNCHRYQLSMIGYFQLLLQIYWTCINLLSSWGVVSFKLVHDNNGSGSSNKLEGLQNAINHYQSKNDDGNYDDRIAKL